MKKTLLSVVLFLTSLATFAQIPPADFPDGAEGSFFGLFSNTQSEINAWTVSAGTTRIAWNVTSSELQWYNGTTWVCISCSGTTTLQEAIAADPDATSKPNFQGGIDVGLDNGTPAIVTLKGGTAGSANLLIASTLSAAVLSHPVGISFTTNEISVNGDPVSHTYEDGYNASTNDLSLSDADSNPNGWETYVTVAGSQDFGSGSISFGVGDIVQKLNDVYRKKVDNNQSGGGGSSTAVATTYDNSDSSLSANNVKAGLDELDAEKANLTGNSDDILLGDGTTTSLSALDPSASVTPAGQIYVNNFNDLTGLIIDETAVGNVSIEPVIGRVTPNVTNALTIENTVAGNNHAAIDLQQIYENIWLQYYVNIIDPSGATGPTANVDIGASVDPNNIRIIANHSTGNFRYFANSPSSLDFNHITTDGVWELIGLHIDRVAQTMEIYQDRMLIATVSIPNQDIRYITLGGTGDNVVGYKLQFASLTVNENGFQDVIENTNGLGDYTTRFVDPTVLIHPDYTTDWTGHFDLPIDLDGDGTMDNGPVAYTNDVGVTNIFSKPWDKFVVLGDQDHYLETLNSNHNISFTGNPTSSTIYPKLDKYGSGEAIVKNGILVTSGWTLHDAVNNVWKQAIPNVSNATGAWDSIDDLALRETYDLAYMSTYIGVWYADATNFYIRLYDEADPNVRNITIGSDQRPTYQAYTQITNIHFKYANILVGEGMDVYDCKFSRSSGATVTLGRFHDNICFNLWGGTDYGNTQATATPSASGLGSSGDGGGIGVNEGALVYRNVIEDAYLAMTIDSDAHDAVVAFNVFKNSISNTLQIAGSGNGDPERPIIIGNNTFYGGGRHVDDDPYHIVRPQPHHTFVHQNGGYANFWYLNNVMSLHYNENSGFDLQDGNSSCNLMSFVTLAYENAVGRLGYNIYYITPISTTPAVIFNGGAGNNIATWRTNMALESFTDIDGVSPPDSTSEVVTSIPTVIMNATATSGKWLETDATPRRIGGAYPYPYADLGITKNMSGEDLGTYLNIGAY